MKTRVLLIAGLWLLAAFGGGSTPAFGQGAVSLINRLPRDLDARVTFLDGSPIDARFGFVAQFWGGPAGTPIEQLQPLTPTTAFGTGVRAGYVTEVVARVPGVQVNESATLVMRVYEGAAWDVSTCRGESNPITLTLGPYEGGVPPPDPLGLQPFSVNCVPEPSTLALVVCGAVFVTAVRLCGKGSNLNCRKESWLR